MLLTFVIVTLENLLVFQSFIFVIHLIILWEWLDLLTKNIYKKSVPLVIFFLCIFSTYEQENHIFFINFIVIFSILFWALLTPFFLIRKKTISGTIGIYFAVSITLSSFYASLWALDMGLTFFLSVLLVVWIADSFAYFVGRFFGKYKLAPKISPKKTWEGVFGAITANFLFAWISIKFNFGWFSHVNDLTNVLFVFLLVFCSTLIAVLGDLFQSLLKREAKVKDSGKLLPGHGGFYDRFDAVVAVCPFLMFGVKLTQ